MRISKSIFGILIALPLVSGCLQPQSEPLTKIELTPFTASEAGFSVEMPEPRQDRSADVGRAYVFNCPDGSYKIIANMKVFKGINMTSQQGKQLGLEKAFNDLKTHAGQYVDATNSEATRDFLLDSRYQGFEDKGTTGSIGGNSDGRNHMKLKYSDNEIALPPNVLQGAYIVRGFIGDNCAYIVAAEGKPEFVNSENTTKFLDSFKIDGPSKLSGI